MTPKPYINQRLCYGGACCTVRYIGEVEGTKGEWLGVEWDRVEKGKHSGEYEGKQYFECKLPNSGSFIRPTREVDPPISFLEGLKRKYTTVDDPQEPRAALSLTATKVIEEVGFDKILKKLARLKELEIVLLDALRISRADDVEEIRETCPKIEELDISRNLIEDLQTVAQICSALPNLRALRIGGNRFKSLDITLPEGHPPPFAHVTALEISNTFLSWEETSQILAHFPLITTLESSLNNISTLPPTLSLPSTIHTLNLERNAFTALSALAPLTSLTHLTTLILSHNLISTTTCPTPFTSITHLDLSFNSLPSLHTLDTLPPLFPSLLSIRVSHNPFCALLPLEQAHILTIARFPEGVKMLNFSTITYMERQNAEMYYLSRIAQELASAPEEEEKAILERHARWKELCELHGAPRIDRVSELKKRDLNAKLVELEFISPGADSAPVVKRIPRSVSVSLLKGVLGRMFGVGPLGVRLEVEVEGEERVEMEDGSKEVGWYFERENGRVIVGRDGE